MTVIDAHLHVWDTQQLRYPWLDREPPLNRPFGMTDLAEEIGDAFDKIDGFVFVQADCLAEQSFAEVESVTELASEFPIIGIVAFAPLEQGAGVGAWIERLAANDRVVGVRRLLQSEERGFALTPEFIRGARELANSGLAFDAGVRHEQLPDVIGLADAVPELRIVLDHLGKPDPGAEDQSAWRDNVDALAHRENVSCKLSGLAAQAGTSEWMPAQFEPFLDHALEAFGPERCLFGSDWPASSVQTDYLRWWEFVETWAGALATHEAESVMWRSAADVYRLRGFHSDRAPH